MAEYIKREDVIETIREEVQEQISRIGMHQLHIVDMLKVEDAVNRIQSADAVERDEGIRMGAELAAMHGSDATSRELEKAYLDGVEEGIKKAESKRKTEKWITVKYPLYECSLCGAVYQDVGYGFNFCPNCGADMRGES